MSDTIQQSSPDTLITVYTYDPDYNLTKKVDATAAETDLAYDALDRLTTRTYPADSTLNVTIYFDSASHGYGIGRLTGTTDQAGSLSRSYDARGHITTDARTTSIGQLFSTGYTCESAGRLSSITYASAGWKVAYTRDSAGQITAVTDTQPGHSATNLATSVTHLPFGPASSWTYGNGITDARTFDLDYRMTSITDHGTSNIQYLSFGHDADDNVTSITDHVTPADNQTFGYDSLSRISFASGPYGTVGSITYDSASNRLSYGATSYTIASGSNRMTAIGASAVTYISTGNISGIGKSPWTYYKSNQMATDKPGTNTTQFYYDAFGLRPFLKQHGHPHETLISDPDGQNILEETSNGAETDYVYLDGIPLSDIKTSTAAISALHTDHIATVQRATNASKAIVWTGTYNPDGLVTPTTSIVMDLRLLGQFSGPEADYINGFRDRVSQKSLAGYMETDPTGFAGPAPFTRPGLLPGMPPMIGISMQPGQQNLYAYAGNNPVTYTDPSGEIVPEAFGISVVGGILVFESYESLRHLPNLTSLPFTPPVPPPPLPPLNVCTINNPTGLLGSPGPLLQSLPPLNKPEFDFEEPPEPPEFPNTQE
jgi:YD repeat-containing protein